MTALLVANTYADTVVIMSLVHDKQKDEIATCHSVNWVGCKCCAHLGPASEAQTWDTHSGSEGSHQGQFLLC